MYITFDDSNPGFNARRMGIGGLIGYRFKKLGLFFSARLVGKQIVSNSLGGHVAYQNTTFNDGVRQLGVLVVPAFLLFGVMLNLSILVGVPNAEFHEQLRQMRESQERQIAIQEPKADQAAGEIRAETGGASGTDWA